MKRLKILFVMVCILSCFSLTWFSCEKKTEEKVKLETENDKLSYVIGTQFGKMFNDQVRKNIESQGYKINHDAFVMGVKDVIIGNELVLDDGEMAAVSIRFQKSMQSDLGVKNLDEAKSFLEENRKNQGIMVLQSGLQYKIINKGTGRSPEANDKVKVHYRGTLLNGREFDSSYKRGTPAEFPVNQVIPGWIEALQLMKEGGKWQLFIPPNLAYGERGMQGIPPNSALIFEVELLEIVK